MVMQEYHLKEETMIQQINEYHIKSETMIQQINEYKITIDSDASVIENLKKDIQKLNGRLERQVDMNEMSLGELKESN